MGHNFQVSNLSSLQENGSLPMKHQVRLSKIKQYGESAVKIVKKIFMKADCMDDDAYLALLAHRPTPSTNDTRSSF